MEHNSEIVAEGKLIAETSYLDRARKYTELSMEGIKIDYYDAKNRIVHEVKKSDKVERAHVAQVIYYLYVLEKNGISSPAGIIDYPKLKQRESIYWENNFIDQVQHWKKEIQGIIDNDSCPELIKKSICKSCSYFELCHIQE